MKSRRSGEEQQTQFLNVDLDVFSKTPLDRIAAAFGEKVFVLHVGRWARRYSAHFELAGYSRNPQADRLISRFVDLVKQLPRSERRLWDRADAREFNIGIEASERSTSFELRLRPETLSAVASVDGRIVVTVYAPERVLRSAGRGRRQNRPPNRRLQPTALGAKMKRRG